MKDFVTLIKCISTEEFIRFWGEISIQIYRDQFKKDSQSGLQSTINFPLTIYQYGFIEKHVTVMLSAWDIPEMIYTSICESNDYRNGHMTNDMAGRVTNLYRGYENNKTKGEYLQDSPLRYVYAYLMGITYEQFGFQSLAWTLQNFNRIYHILVASDRIDRREIIDINEIVNKQFGFGLDDLLMTEIIILWLCNQHSDPLTAPEELYCGKVSRIVTKEKIEKIIDYYSVDYGQVRNSPLKKQIFYTKPFVKTQRQKQTLLVSMHLWHICFADSLYWLERDYYLNNNLGQAFLNAFGNMFEDYFRELAELYLPHDMWDKIPEGKEKSADFYIEFEEAVFLLELKSGTMGLGAKQQVPDMQQIEKFYSNNIRKAYKQLKASEKVFLKKGKPIIKVFLLYEFTNNTQMMMLSLPEIFEEDTYAYIFTISDLEMFLTAYKNDRKKFREILESLLENSANGRPKCFLNILVSHEADINMHFAGERDYFEKILQKLVLNIEKDLCIKEP